MKKAAIVATVVGICLAATLALALCPRVAAGGYDRDAAEAYADNWSCNNCEDEDVCNSDYRCYPGRDCTNFASQVLHEGGYPYRGWDTWSVFHWFHRWYADSETWYNTPMMNEFFSQYPDDFEYKGWPTYLDKADIYLFDFPPTDNIPDHAAVIVGDGLKDQHSPPRKRVAWDANVDPGTGFWSIHVKW